MPGTTLDSETQWGAEQTSRNQSECPPFTKAQTKTGEGVRRVSRETGKSSTHASKHWIWKALALGRRTSTDTQCKPGAQTWVVQKQEMTRGAGIATDKEDGQKVASGGKWQKTQNRSAQLPGPFHPGANSLPPSLPQGCHRAVTDTPDAWS